MPACRAEVEVVFKRRPAFLAVRVCAVERLNFSWCGSSRAIGSGLNQVNGVNTVLQQLLHAVLVENGLLKRRFDLPAPLLSLLGIPNGGRLLQAHLQVTHEGLHRGLFIHGNRFLLKHINACPTTRR